MEKNKSTVKTIATGVLWSYGERFLAQAITLIVSIILARILDPEHYGIIAIVQIFITICDALVTGGFGNALVQKKDAEDVDFNSITWVSIFLAIILYCLLFFGAPFISDFYSDELLTPVLRVMGLRFFFSAFNSVQQAYVQRKMIFKKFFFATLGGTIFSAFLGIGMAIIGFGVWALVAQYLSNTVIDTIILYLTIDWKPKFQLSFVRVKRLWQFGSRMLAATMIFTIKDNIRSLIIGKKFSSSDLAFYNQGKKYPAIVVSDIVESLGKVLFPLLSNEQDSRDKIKSLMRQAIRLSSYLLTPIIIGMISSADVFVSVVLTEKWLPCVPYFRILCLVYLTRSLSTIFQKALLSIGYSGANLLHETITSIATVVLIFLAAFIFENIELIAWSYVMVMLIGLVIFSVFIKRSFSYGYFEMVKDYFPSLIMSLFMGGSVYLCGYLPINNIFKLVLQILIGIVIYISLSVVMKDKSYRYLRSKVVDLINSKTKRI